MKKIKELFPQKKMDEIITKIKNWIIHLDKSKI